MTLKKTKEEIKLLREGGKRHFAVMLQLKEAVKAGVSTQEIDSLAEKLIRKGGDEPSILNYQPFGATYPFPASVCISINEEIVHGIPGERIIREGDIVGLDFCLTHKGLVTDGATTFAVGQIDSKVKKLIEITQEAICAGIQVARAGNKLGDIGHAIELCAQPYKYGVVRGLGGHGVGHAVHEMPFVQNFGRPHTGMLLSQGMVLALEPMFTLGSPKIKMQKNGYTYVSSDHSLSAHFEHTIAITKGEPLILTAK
ncbi:type I methionyl aminopeptidase [Patescibacteria group bacterium]|nr:type I methionyl aminopeptidase [Patescibacteria group bacterium]MBU1730162.1 type I methionyl aminopeptidase [Patescibacteria group bacterium]MBU1956703.1 type I methionyl aminopeptidase [Patescibacteria group bacterium]MBU2010375.1 type I methionyl aminopeptidase [Patescibacteria group bacterium]